MTSGCTTDDDSLFLFDKSLVNESWTECPSFNIKSGLGMVTTFPRRERGRVG